MNIDWNVIVTGLIAPLCLFVVNFLLDLKVAPRFVKWFWFVPVRSFMRRKPYGLSGKWDNIWHLSDSESFAQDTDRHSHSIIRQLGDYCYTEFSSKGKTYAVFGKIQGSHFIGDWYDLNDENGYFGAFQLQIIDSNNLSGVWIGHSKYHYQVKSGAWVWNKINS